MPWPPLHKGRLGHALDQLFAFAGGRPLSRALLNEWRSSMDGLAASTVNVRLSARLRSAEEELTSLDTGEIQLRENRWVIADLRGKGGRVRIVAVPLWVKHATNAWQAAAGIEDGPLLRGYPQGRQGRPEP